MMQPPETPDLAGEASGFDQPERYPAPQVAQQAEAHSNEAPEQEATGHEAPRPVETSSPQPQAFMSAASERALTPETSPAPSAEDTATKSSTRRRSTVREKAPVMTEDTPASAPEAASAPSDPATTTPIAPEPTDSDADAKSSEQRRVGWWARTFGGG